MMRVAKHPTAIVIVGKQAFDFLPVVTAPNQRVLPVFKIKEPA